MKTLFFACAGLLGLATTTLQAQTCSLTTIERETAVPQANAELRGLAGQQTAVLADLLRLSQLQARSLQKAQYEKLWQFQVQEETQPAGLPVPADPATTVLRAYYRHLLRVLSPDQYGTLLWLESPAIAPFAPLNQPTHYVPASQLLPHHKPAHRP